MYPDGVPSKVVAAQQFLHFIQGVMYPGDMCGDMTAESRSLSPKERIVYEAALEVLRLYFTGEQEFAPSYRSPSEQPPDDEGSSPTDKVPVAAE